MSPAPKKPPRALARAQPVAAESLRIDAEQMRRILPHLVDSLADPLVVVDADRRVVAANRRYLEAFGASRETLVGTLCHESLNCPERTAGAEAGSCAACEVFRTHRPSRVMRSAPDAGGTPRRWEVSFNPVVDETGALTHVVEVWRDISERRQLELQLSHSERLASLGILAAGVAHEVNNPMAAVLTGIESLLRWIGRRDFGAGALDEAREVLGVLEREARRCRETTDKLMLLARPYSEAPGWVDLNRAARDTLALLRHETQKRGLRTVEDLEPGLPPLWARESSMRSVCMNLALNAVQAMEPGGTLTVRTRARGGTIELRVEDTGPGVPHRDLERIWDPFFTTKPVGQGTGLGLSITQRIVARHGGSIRVESPPGGGARFCVELPVAGSGGTSV